VGREWLIAVLHDVTCRRNTTGSDGMAFSREVYYHFTQEFRGFK
jgi:hypothetical protein